MARFGTATFALTMSAAAWAVLAQPAAAQPYPSQTVTMIVAFPAGGLADIVGRLVATKLDRKSTRLNSSHRT